jgi:hypothetical protein
MIKANELRIGNCINNGKQNIRVSATTFNTDISQYNPIPLTEEWLLKFGFEVYKFDHKKNQYRFKDRLIVIRDDLFCDYGTGVIINHVHQLQNLYFCLCGEELTIKEVNNEQ